MCSTNSNIMIEAFDSTCWDFEFDKEKDFFETLSVLKQIRCNHDEDFRK
jgi:hypothetical protein